MQLGLIGLGKMGGNMRERLRRAGHEVVGYDRNPDVADVRSMAAMVKKLDAPRVVWVMVPSGAPTRDTIVKLADLLVWVLDPQKYADAAVHDRYLAPLAGHAEVMLIVLNHIDTVPADRRPAMIADVRRLLE